MVDPAQGLLNPTKLAEGQPHGVFAGSLAGKPPYSSQCETQSTVRSMVALGVKDYRNSP